MNILSIYFHVSTRSIGDFAIVFFKAFVKKSTDDANAKKIKDQRETKRRRLSSL